MNDALREAPLEGDVSRNPVLAKSSSITWWKKRTTRWARFITFLPTIWPAETGGCGRAGVESRSNSSASEQPRLPACLPRLSYYPWQVQKLFIEWPVLYVGHIQDVSKIPIIRKFVLMVTVPSSQTYICGRCKLPCFLFFCVCKSYPYKSMEGMLVRSFIYSFFVVLHPE